MVVPHQVPVGVLLLAGRILQLGGEGDDGAVESRAVAGQADLRFTCRGKHSGCQRGFRSDLVPSFETISSWTESGKNPGRNLRKSLLTGSDQIDSASWLEDLNPGLKTAPQQQGSGLRSLAYPPPPTPKTGTLTSKPHYTYKYQCLYTLKPVKAGDSTLHSQGLFQVSSHWGLFHTTLITGSVGVFRFEIVLAVI